MINPTERATLLERHQASAMCELARESAPLADGWMSFDGRGSYLNKATGFSGAKPFADGDVDALVRFFAERGVEPKIELSPYVPSAMLTTLARAGFVLRELENKLVRSMRPTDGFEAPMLPGLAIDRVDPADAEAVETYAQVAARGFLPPGAALTERLLAFGRASAQSPVFDCFVARLNGEPVGGGCGDARDGILALAGASVDHRFRRRGIQQALMAVRLARGRERGCTLATVTCSPGIATERNALRLGFELAYTRVVLVRPGEGLEPSP